MKFKSFMSAIELGQFDRVKKQMQETFINKKWTKAPIHLATLKYGFFPLHLAVSCDCFEWDDTGFTVGRTTDENKLANIRKGAYLEIVKYLIDNGADINAEDDIMRTPLHFAAEIGSFDIVDCLVELDVDVNKSDKYGRTPLHFAAEGGHLNIVECLISKGAVVTGSACKYWTSERRPDEMNHFDFMKRHMNAYISKERGWTPLHGAADEGHLDVVKYLVSKGASISSSQEYLGTPLDIAADSDHLDVVKYLISKGADVSKSNKLGRTALHGAAECGNLDAVKLLISKGANVSTSGRFGTPLHVAVAKSYLDIVEYLIVSGADVNAVDDNLIQTPLHFAAEIGHLDIVKCLVSHGANVNESYKSKWTPLHFATQGGHSDVIEYLISNGADIGASAGTFGTPLDIAAKKGHLNNIKYLISNGADVSASKGNCDTPLHKAAKDGKWDVVHYLIDNGANVNAINNVGQTPLHCVAADDNFESIECLISHGANVKHKDDDGRMLLHFVSIYDRMDIVEQVFATVGDDAISETDKYGRTAIHFAAACGRMDAFEYLLSKGGDAFKPDKHRRTPLHYASVRCNLDIVKYLTSKGANVNAVDIGGCAPIHYASANSNVNIERLLASLNEVDERGCSPSHYASANGNLDNSDLFAPLTVDSDEVDKEEYSTTETENELFISNARDVVQHLIDCGANPEIKTKACCRPRFSEYDGGDACSSCCIMACMNIFLRDVRLRRQKEINFFIRHEMRPVQLAGVAGNPDVLRCLLQSGCMMNVKDDKGQTVYKWVDRSLGKYPCRDLLTEQKRKRRKTEYSVWNFKDMSVIIRKFKILCISSVIDEVKSNILPIDGPIILFGIDEFNEDCYKNVVGPVLRLVSKRFHYNENVVMNENDRIKDVWLRLEKFRGWNCVLRYPGGRKVVPHELTVVKYLESNSWAHIEFHIETAIRWTDADTLSVNYCDDTPFIYGTHYADTLFAWFHGGWTMRQVTEAIIGSLQKMICYGINQTNYDDNIIKYFIKRLATNKTDLLVFLRGDEKIKGSTTVADILSPQSNIRIHQKFAFNSIDFILEEEEAILRERSLQNILVLKPIFPYHPLIVGPSSRHMLVDEVRMALESLLNIEDVILIYNGQIPKGEENVSEYENRLVDYAAVYSCPKLVEKKQIGSGGFGRVFKCREEDSDFFALKVMLISDDSESLSDTMLSKDIIRELTIAAKVPTNDRIISYHAFYKETHTFNSDFCIRMPLMQDSLCGLLKKEGPMLERDIRHFSYQILQGLNHLHQNNVMHRDLKGANVLLDKDRNVKLSDFGLSKHLNDLASSQAVQEQVRSHVGTYNWMAPEVMKDPSKYGLKADVWSFGATVVEMITGQPPYAEDPPFKMCSKIMEEGVIEYKPPNALSNELKSFVDSCLIKRAADRPMCCDLLHHSFLTD